MDDNQLLRYSRQILLPEVDISGQHRLLESTVLIVGMGGLGSPACMYLASAGVGTLILNDDDVVDLSNLQRQILHGTADIGMPKTESAARALRALNPDLTYETIQHRLDAGALQQVVARVDVVLDCSDNLATRFLVNRACVLEKKPLVSGAVIRLEGQIAVFDPASPDSPCYNCLYGDMGEMADTCSRNGVLSPLPGVIGSMQAIEAIKLLIHSTASQTGYLQIYDAWVSEWQRFRLKRNPRCATCGTAD